MDDIERHADEMLDLMRKCPSNGVTSRDIAVAYLRRQHSAGKVEATDELGKALGLKKNEAA